MKYQGSCYCGRQGNRMAAVNVRCLEGIDLASVPVRHHDGRSR